MAKILLTEDNVEIRNAYAFELARSGHEVIEAANASEARAALEQKQPDVLVLDMLMPGLSGLEFLQQNNPKAQLPQLKIIALSNIDTPNVMEKAKAAGADQYVLKVDVTPHQLESIINQLAA